MAIKRLDLFGFFWFTQNLGHRLIIRVVLSVQIKDAGCVIILLKVPDLLVELLARVTLLILTWGVILIM